MVDVKIVNIRHLNQLYKSKYEKYFFVKRITIMMLRMYQVFSSLQGHLHFFVHFFFTFMEYFFIDHPIYALSRYREVDTKTGPAREHRYLKNDF